MNRLMKEFEQFSSHVDFAFAELQNPDDISHWLVYMNAPPGSEIEKDLKICARKFHVDHILIHLEFPPAYPIEPPFIWIEYPVIRVTGSGWIMCDGVPCWEIIGKGWSPVYSPWDILLEFRSMIEKGARADTSGSSLQRISKETAENGFKKLMTYHPTWVREAKK